MVLPKSMVFIMMKLFSTIVGASTLRLQIALDDYFHMTCGLLDISNAFQNTILLASDNVYISSRT